MSESLAKTSLRSQTVTSEAKHTIPVHGRLSCRKFYVVWNLILCSYEQMVKVLIKYM